MEKPQINLSKLRTREGVISFIVGAFLALSSASRFPEFWDRQIHIQVVILVMFLLLYWIVSYLLMVMIIKNRSIEVAINSLVITLGLSVILVSINILPNVTPSIRNTLEIVVNRQNIPNSEARWVNLIEFRNVDGRVVPLNKLERAGNWELTSNGLVSDGIKPSSLKYKIKGKIERNIQLLFLGQPAGGKVDIYINRYSFNEYHMELDLYKPSFSRLLRKLPIRLINREHPLVILLRISDFVSIGFFIFVLCAWSIPYLFKNNLKIDNKRLEWTIGILGIIFYLVLQLNLHIYVMAHRTVPVETDDGYMIIVKAVEVQSCFMQDCPALRDLYPQFTAPTSDHDIAYVRYRNYSRVFYMYNPLHAVIMASIQRLNLSWEAVFNIQTVLGAILIGIAMFYWLTVLWNPAAAGIAMAWLAFHLFAGQGLHYIVATNWSLGLGFLIWALIISKRQAAGWVLPIGILALVLAHPSGKLYSLVALSIYFILELLEKRRLERKTILILGAASLLVVLAFILPEIITVPVLTITPDPPPPGWTVTEGLSDGINRVYGLLGSEISYYGGIYIVGLLLLVGFSYAAVRREYKIFVMGGILFCLLIASLFYMNPIYPANVFERVWVAMGAFLTGVMSSVIWMLINSFVSWLKGQNDINASSSRFNRAFIVQVSSLILLMLVIISSANKTESNINAYTAMAEKMKNRQNVTLDSFQPTLLLERTQTCSNVDILYTAEVPMYYYFSRGTLQCGAVYLPAVAGTAEEREWILDNINIRYLVSWLPLPYNKIELSPISKFEIHGLVNGLSTNYYLYLENPDQTSSNLIIYTQASGATSSTKKIIPPHWTGLLPIEFNEVSGNTIINLKVANGRIQIKGVRVGDMDSGLFWPWDKGINLIYSPDGSEPKTIHFESVNLYPYPEANISVNVLADGGDTVLAEIEKIQ